MKNSGRSAAFLKKMSDIGEQEYAWLVIASIAHGGHHWATAMTRQTRRISIRSHNRAHHNGTGCRNTHHTVGPCPIQEAV